MFQSVNIMQIIFQITSEQLTVIYDFCARINDSQLFINIFIHFIKAYEMDLSSEKGVSLPITTGSQTTPEAWQLQQKSTQALRGAFNHWIRSLPMEERFLALKVYSAGIVPALRSALAGKEESHKKQEENECKLLPRKIQKGFYDALVFITDGRDYLDHICFQFGLLECPEKLFDLLTASLEVSTVKPLQQALKNRSSPEVVCKEISQSASKQQTILSVLKFLRQQVLLRFRESLLDSQFLTRSLQTQKRRKKEFNLHWKHLTQQQRSALLLLGHEDIASLHKELTINDIFLSEEEIEKEISEIMALQKNQFCNRIFKVKLKHSLSDVVDYYELIYHAWKKDLDKNRKKKVNRETKNHTQKESKDQRQYKDGKNFTKVQRQTKQKEYAKRVQARSNRKSASLESNETNVTDNEKYEKFALQKQIQSFAEYEQYRIETKIETREIQVEKQMVSNKKKSQKPKKGNKSKHRFQTKQRQIQQNQQHKQLTYNPQSQLSVIPEKRRSKPSRNRKQSDIIHFQEQVKNLHSLRLSNQLQQMCDKTSEEANKYHERRIIAFERIQYLLSFYNISIKLFGSCACGIALANSDIDIAIDSSVIQLYEYLPEGVRLLAVLESLEQVFRSQGCFVQIKLIRTASIPVIKLTLDTSIEFLQPAYGQTYYQLNRQHFAGPIEADITVETLNSRSQCSHLGLISTEAINGWLQQIPSLHSIVIFLKLIFKKRRFHITYEGGMNTFSIIVLIVAYIYYHRKEEQSNTAVVLQGFLRYYAFEFDEKQTGIDLLRGKQNPFYKKDGQRGRGKQVADLQMLDPKSKGKNMTRNCYLFKQIRQLFGQILSKCFQEPLLILKKNNIGQFKLSSEQKAKFKGQIWINRNIFLDFLTQ